MKRAVALGLLGAIGLVAIRQYQFNQSMGGTLQGVADVAAATLYQATGVDLMNWQAVAARPENAQYVAWAHQAEAQYGLPPDLLVRQIYQESRYRPDIISGQTVSSAGAVGIMQIVPKWHPGVDPTNPAQSIFYAAQYDAQLYRQFGSWELALQAYNWGPGNLAHYLAGNGSTVPTETANYSGEIIADLQQAGVSVA